eukprot:sb/3479414/
MRGIVKFSEFEKLVGILVLPVVFCLLPLEKVLQSDPDLAPPDIVTPQNCEVFRVLVGADGKRNSIPGFQRKEFRAKLAIGITANFVNKNTDEEAKIEEISGVAALFNQDNSDVLKLLSYENVDRAQLLNFNRQAADFSAGLPHYEFAVDPVTGREDVAIFDFTSMYSAEYAARILEKRGKRLLVGLVGDGLMEPFWPLGTGCARGFLSCMDLIWTFKRLQCGTEPVEVLAERMALYQLLHQTKNENMNKSHAAYTLDPKTRRHEKKGQRCQFDNKSGHLSSQLISEPTETSKHPIRTRYLGRVTGYQPIRITYNLIRTVPGTNPYHSNPAH